MVKVEIGTSNFTEVFAMDTNGPGGASHHYQVSSVETPRKTFANVEFQSGGVKETGVNGCHNEDLIAIVIDRLQDFQAGDFACRENAIALTKLEEAMMWLNSRTQKRMRRGVEGTSVV